jgi:uncharacterized protein YndB with AHSA1/START domain
MTKEITMTTERGAAPGTEREDLVLTRVFDAPRALVWQAWTEAEHFSKWYCPYGFTIPECELDPRPGGVLRIIMRGPAGSEHPMHAVFDEVAAPDRLVFTSTLDGADGAPMFVVQDTVTFDEQAGNRTLLTLRRHIVMATDEAAGPLAGIAEGTRQTFERLAELLGAMQ